MRRFLIITLAAALVVTLMAGLGGVATGATPAASFEGSVRADDGEPIEGVLVQACAWDTGLIAGEARTAADGAYSIGGLAFGGYRVSAEAGGYVAEWYAEATAFRDAAPLSVADLSEGGGIDFTLTPVLKVRTYPASFSGTAVRLNGRLESLGAEEDCTTSFIWGAAPGSYTHEMPGAVRGSTGFFSFVLEDLEPGTVCYYKARGVGGAGVVYGEEAHFRARDTEAPAMTGLKLDVGATAVVLSWTTEEPASYQIDFGLTDEYGSSTGEQPGPVTSFAVTLNVTPDSHYQIILRDRSRNKWVSGDLTFDTAAYYGGRSSWPWKVLGFAVVGVAAVVLGFVWVRAR